MLLLLIILIVVFGGGGGYWMHGRYGGSYGYGGGFGIIIFVILMFYLFGAFGHGYAWR